MFTIKLLHTLTTEETFTVDALSHLSSHLFRSKSETLDAHSIVLIWLHVLIPCLNLRLMCFYFLLTSDILVGTQETAFAEFIVAYTALIVMVGIPEYIFSALRTVV